MQDWKRIRNMVRLDCARLVFGPLWRSIGRLEERIECVALHDRDWTELTIFHTGTERPAINTLTYEDLEDCAAEGRLGG